MTRIILAALALLAAACDLSPEARESVRCMATMGADPECHDDGL